MHTKKQETFKCTIGYIEGLPWNGQWHVLLGFNIVMHGFQNRFAKKVISNKSIFGRGFYEERYYFWNNLKVHDCCTSVDTGRGVAIRILLICV